MNHLGQAMLVNLTFDELRAHRDEVHAACLDAIEADDYKAEEQAMARKRLIDALVDDRKVI